MATETPTLTATQSARWMEREQAVMFQMFRRQPVVIERGKGVRVWDADGKEYLDMIQGIAVNALGHAHPVVQRTLAEQGAKLLQASYLFYTEPQIELAELLVQHSPFDRAWFCNSGTEANEAAIKLARKWGKRNRNGAYGIITAEHGFHGRTFGSMAATPKDAYKAPFLPLPEGFEHVAYDDMDALERATNDTTVAVLLEPVQGEAGVYGPSESYLRDVQDFCRAKNILFMVDEVQTGVGRLGTLWGFERAGVQPDVMSLAKGLGGGVPIGAILAREDVAIFEPGDHGSTFGGNALTCAVAASVIRYILENDVLGNVQRMGAVFKDGLRALQTRQPLITAVRGDGLLLAIDLAAEVAGPSVGVGLEEGLILNNTGPATLRFAPPLTITPAEIAEVLTRLERVLTRVAPGA